MLKGFCVLVGLTLALTASAGLEDEIRECALLESDTARLRCFDAIELPSAESVPTISDPPVSLSSAAEADFGLPAVSAEERGPSEISSRHVGEFSGWSGDTVFRLENGQVWRQAETDRVHWIAESPLITIRRTRVGTFWLTVEGINSQVRVRRVE